MTSCHAVYNVSIDHQLQINTTAAPTELCTGSEPVLGIIPQLVQRKARHEKKTGAAKTKIKHLFHVMNSHYSANDPIPCCCCCIDSVMIQKKKFMHLIQSTSIQSGRGTLREVQKLAWLHLGIF